MKKITLALDWTPNINHIGFFVAKDKGFYEALGLEVELRDPSSDQYQITPAKQVENGQVDFALCPTESIISYQTKNKPFDLIAIAALLQDDLSAIVVREDSGIESPRDLDGKVYSSYKARYEDAIVREMIKNDGGRGDLSISYPNKLGIWATVLDGEADATWIFLNWEGVEVEQSDQALRYFKLRDYQIPYSYSPVIAASLTKVEERLDAYRLFLQATKKGFLYTQKYLEESVQILRKYVPESDQHIDLARALEVTAPYFGTAEDWGQLDPSVVSTFLDWLYDRDLERNKLSIEEVVTSACLD